MTDSHNAILQRFTPVIDTVIRSVQKKFKVPDCDTDDLRQEANILVLSYAGLIPGTHFNELTVIEAKARGDFEQIDNLVSYTLKLDLSQVIRRQRGSKKQSSLDNLINTDFEPGNPSFEKELINDMDEARLLRRYPLFARNVLDGITQDKLAAELGIDERTVRRRIAGEKRSFLLTMLKRRGIVVEGDEPMYELEEAYRSLTHM